MVKKDVKYLSEDPLKKSYAEEMKEHFNGVVILIIIGLLMWIVTALFDIGSNDTGHQVKRVPTRAEIDQWDKEYEQNGNVDPDIDVSVQYGGK